MLLASLPMWAFLPLVTEIHRGFVFGHLRAGRSFAAAATLSAMLFAGQHLYIIATMGWTIGLASMLLAALLAYPLAFVFDRGHSLAGPAILHTSANAPVMIFTLRDDVMAMVLLPHMGVIVVSLYALAIVQRFLDANRQRATDAVGSAIRPSDY